MCIGGPATDGTVQPVGQRSSALESPRAAASASARPSWRANPCRAPRRATRTSGAGWPRTGLGTYARCWTCSRAACWTWPRPRGVPTSSGRRAPPSTEAARRERDSVLCCWSGDAVPLLLKAAVLQCGPGRRALPQCSTEPCVTARLSALNLAACATLLERQITQSTYRTCLSSSVAARVLARSHRPGASPASERTPAP